MQIISALEARKLLATKPKRSKYRAKPKTVDGIRFASTWEARRYSQLKGLERSGHIKNLRMQVPFLLHAQGGMKVGKYIADFVYVNANGKEIVEDAKGFLTDLFKWKARHFAAEYGSQIVKSYHDGRGANAVGKAVAA